MWKAKLFNKIFGWDYVAYEFLSGSTGLKTEISRLYKSGDETPWFFRKMDYNRTRVHLLTYEDRKRFAFITFHPSKYFSEEVLKEMGLQD